MPDSWPESSLVLHGPFRIIPTGESGEMALEPEPRRYRERVYANVQSLVIGTRESIEYTVPVAYHRLDACELKGANRVTTKCTCPVKDEKRVRSQKKPGLLDQLRDIASYKDVDRNPKSQRGAPRVKTAGKPPGDLSGVFTLDEIVCDIYVTVDRTLEEAGRDRECAAGPVAEVLSGLTTQIEYFGNERPDLARRLAQSTDKWVGQAKATLRITVADAMFGDTVCGNCGGGLKIAWDNNSDVVCIGTPSSIPCGETYPMSEWVALYEKGKK
jgi:hypothetical protein